MPKVEEFCHFYNGFTAETQRAQSFFVRNFLSARSASLRWPSFHQTIERSETIILGILAHLIL